MSWDTNQFENTQPAEEIRGENTRTAEENHTEEAPRQSPPAAARPTYSYVPPRRERKGVSTRAMVVSMAVCMLVSCGLGFSGGILAQRMAVPAAPAAVETPAAEPAAQPTASIPAVQTANTPADGMMTVPEIAAKVADSVVEITTEQVSYGVWMQEYVATGAGSGVIATADGYILTNNHVIEDAKTITVTLRDGTSYGATLVGTDPETDIAVIKVEADALLPAVMGDSDKLMVGEMAVAVGNPLGQLGGTVTDGIISALDRTLTIEGETMNLLQTNAAINPGNSGGGLFNGRGELIGIVNAKNSQTGVEGLGFAIPINDVKTVMEQLIDKGYVSGRIDPGFTLLDITSQQQAAMYRVERVGVYVYSVERGSDAANSGFQSGDCIMALDGTEVMTEADVLAALEGYKPGDTIVFSVQRGSTQGTITMTLTEKIPDAADGFRAN